MKSLPRGPAARQRVRYAMRLSVLEGVTWAFMVGFGEFYFFADAIRLGASALEQALTVSLPLFLGAGGPLLALRLLALFPLRKRVVVAGAAGQAAVLLLLAASNYLDWLTPAGVIAASCAYQVFGQAAGTAWSSWYGDLVPRRLRGRYFSRRNRFIHSASCAGVAAGGLLLHFLEPGSAAEAARAGGTGFAVIFAVAAAFRAASTLLLAASYEPPFSGVARKIGLLRFLGSRREAPARRLLLLIAALQVSVYLSAPYFTPCMLEELRFSYFHLMLANFFQVVSKVFFLPLWGGAIDRYGSRPILSLAAFLVAAIPLPWIWADGLAWVLIAQVLSGFSWAAQEVSQFVFLLDATSHRTRPQLFAAQSMLSGSAQLLGSLLGALIVAGSPQLRVIFAASAAGRLLMALLYARALPVLDGAARPSFRGLLLRVAGVRPSGGLVHRTVTPDKGEAEE